MDYMQRIALKRKIATGAVLLALGFGAGALVGAKVESIANKKLEQRVQECSERVLEQMQKHDEFLQQLPNYDATGLGMDGEGYESWMIKDINEKYGK